MAKFAAVKLADNSIRHIVDGDKEFAGGTPPDVTNRGYKWLPYIALGKPVFNPDTHKIDGGPSDVVTATEVTKTWTVVAFTQAELAARAVVADEIEVRSALLDLADIVIIHIDAHLTKGNIVASDFNPKTRQKYQDLKVLVDRLR